MSEAFVLGRYGSFYAGHQRSVLVKPESIVGQNECKSLVRPNGNGWSSGVQSRTPYQRARWAPSWACKLGLTPPTPHLPRIALYRTEGPPLFPEPPGGGIQTRPKVPHPTMANKKILSHCARRHSHQPSAAGIVYAHVYATTYTILTNRYLSLAYETG